jgi:predicted deacylase
VDPRFAAYLEGHQSSLELALALGLEALDAQTPESYAPGVMKFALSQVLGIPAVLIESHPAGFQVRESVEACAGAIFRAMVHLKMLRTWKPPKQSPKATPIFHRPEAGHALKPAKGGFLGVRRWAGERVGKGDAVAVVRSIETFEIVETLVSSAEGAVGSCGVSDAQAFVKPGDVAATVKRVDWGHAR